MCRKTYLLDYDILIGLLSELKEFVVSICSFVSINWHG
jgi:hypothetical protein